MIVVAIPYFAYLSVNRLKGYLVWLKLRI
jgi:hypothetical protein